VGTYIKIEPGSVQREGAHRIGRSSVSISDTVGGVRGKGTTQQLRGKESGNPNKCLTRKKKTRLLCRCVAERVATKTSGLTAASLFRTG